MKKIFLVPFVTLVLLMVTLFSSGATGTASAHALDVQRQTVPTLANVKALPVQSLDVAVFIWGTNVNARYSSPLGIAFPSCHYFPSTSCPVQGQFTHATVTAFCQQQGATVNAEGITNNWWTLVQGFGQEVWVTNIYIQGGQKIAGVPDCNFTP